MSSDIIEENESIKSIVLDVLENNERSRNDDIWLWYLVASACNPIIDGMSVRTIASMRNDLNIPKFSSVERVRRTLQGEFPHLKATEEVKRERHKRQVVAKNYFGKEKVFVDESYIE